MINIKYYLDVTYIPDDGKSKHVDIDLPELTFEEHKHTLLDFWERASSRTLDVWTKMYETANNINNDDTINEEQGND